ncbi:MAG TPA: antibiotic biosynthesis monooxygenase [Amycolatopsis sp.]|uniref:antibiotic biosynthesis monooxygenase n=1 Tax=Amycolatopsis sp. TaxID=37632 RepID=UPI002B45A80B|nr:antibiotic biosynthesis monooxygenase [Amycolatopsis sp.]HKS47195.1 antibiotic biosynthesis monooxygenase [Amycolatopsis sp.]
MSILSTENAHLTVLNLFSTDSMKKQEQLLRAMREIVDAAAYPGWISSTVHSGIGRPGTANVILWRSGEDLEARYAGEEFKHRTLPLFREITTFIKLLQTTVVFTQHGSSPGAGVEMSPANADYTVIELFGVVNENQDELVDVLGPGQDWMSEVPGYRAHAVLRGKGARGLDGAFAVAYSQWDDKESYDTFRAVPDSDQTDCRRKAAARLASLVTFSESNSYRVLHTRSAP